ncbi:unnamed protein product, partial [Rotaria sp. Silwood1]
IMRPAVLTPMSNKFLIVLNSLLEPKV